jgi:hypothetical protein
LPGSSSIQAEPRPWKPPGWRNRSEAF